MKVCTKCKRKRHLKSFYVQRQGKNGPIYMPKCKECERAYKLGRYKVSKDTKDSCDFRYKGTAHGRAMRLVTSARARSKEHKREFSLDVPWVEYKLKLGVCEVSGIPFDMEVGSNKPFGPSLDRKDNLIGYTKENTQVVCWIYNRAKGVSTHKDVVLLAKAIMAQEILNDGSKS